MMRTIKIRASLVEGAEDELRSMANEIFLNCTANGEWSSDPEDQEDKEKHDYLIELADRLAEALA